MLKGPPKDPKEPRSEATILANKKGQGTLRDILGYPGITQDIPGERHSDHSDHGDHCDLCLTIATMANIATMIFYYLFKNVSSFFREIDF